MYIVNDKNVITEELRNHYSAKFSEFGPSSEGVDWGKEEDVLLRYDKMLAVVDNSRYLRDKEYSFLDVGCGYGGLFIYAEKKNIKLNYTGIDVCENMIQYASSHFKDSIFLCCDVFDMNDDVKFDYVVCNGILTQKLSTSNLEMDSYCHLLIKKMYDLCNTGIAFNVMTTKVNFMVNNLYYRNPVELFGYCISEISRKIKIDHSYHLYEYTIYLYK